MDNEDAFYIVDLSYCAKQYLKWTHYLPRVQPFYAVKTNGNSFIIKIMEKMGSGFDCASIYELKTVQSICLDIDCSKRIIYSHPCKQISHIKYFRDRGVQLTVADNENELIKIKDYWPNAKILIRLKVDDSRSLIPFSSKFGANKCIAIRLLELAKKLSLEVIGCAFHVGTGCYDKIAFEHSLEFARSLFDIAEKSNYGFKFTVLDIGGGFPGVDEEGKPIFSEIAETINQTLHKLFPESEGIFLILYI
jgi:ornithine decarboxylase